MRWESQDKKLIPSHFSSHLLVLLGFDTSCANLQSSASIMSRIIIQNTTILTLDEEDTFYYPGVIEIRDDKIFSIGTWSSALPTGKYDGETIIIDGTDKLVMPGLVDLHFHTSVAKVSFPQSSLLQEADSIKGIWR